MPMVACWPGKIKAESTNDQPYAFWDVLPTLCNVVGFGHPKPCDGTSFATLLDGEERQNSPEQREFLYWEFPGYGGQQAIIHGKWKAVRQNLTAKKAAKPTLELFDLDTDPGETTDVAAKNPGRAEEARRIDETGTHAEQGLPAAGWIDVVLLL